MFSLLISPPPHRIRFHRSVRWPTPPSRPGRSSPPGRCRCRNPAADRLPSMVMRCRAVGPLPIQHRALHGGRSCLSEFVGLGARNTIMPEVCRPVRRRIGGDDAVLHRGQDFRRSIRPATCRCWVRAHRHMGVASGRRPLPVGFMSSAARSGVLPCTDLGMPSSISTVRLVGVPSSSIDIEPRRAQWCRRCDHG